jgi:hypothetical protein
MICIGGIVLIAGLTGAAVELDLSYLIYVLLKKLKETCSVTKEFTLMGRVGEIATIATCMFLGLGGVAAAVIGGIETWQHLPWIPATFITIGIASVVVGVCAHVFVED